MEVTDYVEQCRQCFPEMPSSDLLALVACKMEPHSEGYAYDVNAEFREAVCVELNRTLKQSDRSFAQYLLAQEIRSHDDDEGGINENIKLCAYLLYKLGHVEDALLIWQAKNLNMDTLCGIDVQLVAGAGIETTLEYLKTQNSDDAKDGIAYLEDCIEAGDFDDPESYRQFYERYFAQ